MNDRFIKGGWGVKTPAGDGRAVGISHFEIRLTRSHSFGPRGPRLRRMELPLLPSVSHHWGGPSLLRQANLSPVGSFTPVQLALPPSRLCGYVRLWRKKKALSIRGATKWRKFCLSVRKSREIKANQAPRGEIFLNPITTTNSMRHSHELDGAGDWPHLLRP